MEKCPKCGWFHTNECVPTTPIVMANDHNSTITRTRTPILISAMRLLAREIQSEDGVANAAIAEAADRMEELARQVEQAQHYAPTTIVSVQDQLDGANAAILDLTDQLLKANTRVAELEAAIHSHKDHYIFTTPDFEDLELWKLVEPKP